MVVKIIEVIYCDEGRDGVGQDGNPIRALPSLHTLDGRKILEYDDFSERCDVNKEVIMDLGGE